MKLVFDKADLVKSVGIAMKAVSGKTTMPILECILIDASSNVIKFTSNDMELGIETIVTGMILERGIVALDAKIFSEIVRKLPDNQVTIETDENLVTTIRVKKQNSTFRDSQEKIFPICRFWKLPIVFPFPSSP